jgi:hypothetical protein
MNLHDYNELASQYGHTDSYNSCCASSAMTASVASTAAATDARLSPAQKAMAGSAPLGSRVRKGTFTDTYVAPDGRGGIWVTEVYLARALSTPTCSAKSKQHAKGTPPASPSFPAAPSCSRRRNPSCLVWPVRLGGVCASANWRGLRV